MTMQQTEWCRADAPKVTTDHFWFKSCKEMLQDIRCQNVRSPTDSNIAMKRLREEDSDSGTENDVDIAPTPPKMLKITNAIIKKPDFIVKSKEMQSFFRLLDDPLIYEFLCLDSCRRISDKYLIAMVFAYFKRARFNLRAYSRTNFFVALYLANDVEEDEEDYKYEIFPWALGHNWKKRYMNFLRKREKLWAKIGFRAIVSKKCCEELMSIEPDHWVWKRERPLHHAGAIRLHMREPDDDGYPIGPDGTPRHCKDCEALVEYDSASPGGTSWYVSSSSTESSPISVKSQETNDCIFQGSRFDMKGLEKTLQEDDIWAHKEE